MVRGVTANLEVDSIQIKLGSKSVQDSIESIMSNLRLFELIYSVTSER